MSEKNSNHKTPAPKNNQWEGEHAGIRLIVKGPEADLFRDFSPKEASRAIGKILERDARNVRFRALVAQMIAEGWPITDETPYREVLEMVKRWKASKASVVGRMQDTTAPSGESSTRERRGVSLRQLAEILSDGDLTTEEEIMAKMRHCRNRKPEALGKDPAHSQRKLYAPSAIVDWYEKSFHYLPIRIQKALLVKRLMHIAVAPDV